MTLLERIHNRLKYFRRQIGSIDPHKIAQRKKIPIIYAYDLPENVLGMFCPIGAKGVIYLKPEMPHEQERFVLYHELFHGIFRHKEPAMTSLENMYNPNWLRLSKQEHEAHMGAACAILDGYELYEGQTSLDISRETGCPVKIVEKWVQLGGLIEK